MITCSYVRKKSWSVVWICWKDVYVLLGEIRKTIFLAKTTVIPYFKLIFIYKQWLFITASWEDLAEVVFVSNKCMSSCVICLVVAREIFLLQSDCSAITKVHKPNFSLLSLTYFAKDKQTLKMKDTLYKMDIVRHRPICGLFPLKCQSLRQTFQRIIQALLLAKHLRRFCCWFEWS